MARTGSPVYSRGGYRQSYSQEVKEVIKWFQLLQTLVQMPPKGI